MIQEKKITITKREALGWLQQRPDSIGECDRCHQDDKRLWQLPIELDSETDAGWQYCSECYRKIVNAKIK